MGEFNDVLAKTIDETKARAKHFQKNILKAHQRAFQKHFYIESYGCAMNFSDSEIVASILSDLVVMESPMILTKQI
ncbi:MAG: hypothetical protein R2728_15850 [Chitinophagales bacterium]